MANPRNKEKRSSTLGDMDIHIQFTATGTNATQTITRGKEYVSSIVTSGTGVITVTLKETWNYYLNHIGTVKQASYATAGASQIEITADNSATAATKTMVFVVTQGSGAAVALAANDVVRLTLIMAYVKDAPI